VVEMSKGWFMQAGIGFIAFIFTEKVIDGVH
jgi:hypothetical protein